MSRQKNLSQSARGTRRRVAHAPRASEAAAAVVIPVAEKPTTNMDGARGEMNWVDPRHVLTKYGFRPQRKFSQNFLVSESVVRKIVSLIAPRRSELWVEIGPGPGTLTQSLLQAGARVHAVERDPNMVHVLRSEYGSEALEVAEDDAVTFDFASFRNAHGSRVRVAGNLPYSITGSIFRRLVDQHEHIERCVFMVQKEVAQRLVAVPNTSAYGALSVFVQSVFDCRIAFHVPAGAFFPPPAVTSSVVILHALRPARQTITPEFRDAVRAAFQQRRKMLRQSLLAIAGMVPQRLQLAFHTSGIDGSQRGETLTIEDFGRLASALRQND